MSGLAGGGAMVIWRAKEKKAYVVDYGMRSPRALDPADYPLTGKGANNDLFAWPLVKDDRNVEGATAVAVLAALSGAVAVAAGAFVEISHSGTGIHVIGQKEKREHGPPRQIRWTELLRQRQSFSGGSPKSKADFRRFSRLPIANCRGRES